MSFANELARQKQKGWDSTLMFLERELSNGEQAAIPEIAIALYKLQKYKEAVQHCQKYIKHATCKLVLGVCYYSNEGIEIDYDKSERLLKGAASEGKSIAKSNLGILFHAKEQYEDEYFWVNEGAAEGITSAKARLKKIIQEGRGIPPYRYNEHIEYLNESASSSSDAMFRLGAYHHYGQFGLPVDHTTAITWYEKAAAKNSASAMNNLGTIYESSDQIQRDAKKAEKYYHSAMSADASFSPAVVNLANIYISGKSGNKNLKEALKLLETIPNCPDGQAALSRLYSCEGEFQDKEKAFAIQKQAADSGSSDAVRDLADSSTDEGQKLRWLTVGAESGDVSSQVQLGKILTANEEYVDALHWLNKAAQKGNIEGRSLLQTLGEHVEQTLFI